MNQDATARRRRRPAASRAAGPPTAAIDTPAANLDQSGPATATNDSSDPAPADPQQTEQNAELRTEQLDSGRRRTRRQRSQRRSDDPQDSGGGSVMPPDRPSRARPAIEPRGENSTDEQDADESVAAQGVPTAGRRNDARRSDHGLRGLEASRSTQVSPTAAMRAREYATPTAEDLAEAERDVQLVRRKYVPPTPLQASRRRGRRCDPAD